MSGTREQKSEYRMGPLALFLRGIAMGAADVVPGVSGGTIAFITGIYEQFINALRSLSLRPLLSILRGRLGVGIDELRQFHWHTLLPLGAGVAVAIILLSKVVTTCMDEYQGPTYALFFGLILFSTIAPILQIKKRSPPLFLAFLAAFKLAWVFVALHPESPPKRVISAAEQPTLVFYAGKIRSETDITTLDKIREQSYGNATLTLYDPKGIATSTNTPKNTEVIRSKEDLQTWYSANAQPEGLTSPAVILGDEAPNLAWIFLSGFIAISAMVLPGLSGSFLLLFLGLYHVIFGALHGLVGGLLTLVGRSGDPLQQLGAHTISTDFFVVLCFGLGVICGLAIFSRVVAWLFTRAHDLTLCVLTGLMLGALRLPAEKIFAGTNQFTENIYASLAAAIIGAIVVLVLLKIDLNRTRALDTKINE